MDEQHLYLPLLSAGDPVSTKLTASATNTKAASSTTAPYHSIFSPASCIVVRLLLIVSIGIISIWANYEASKGFVITVVHDMKGTPLGDKFSLFYVFNDEATRLVQSSTTFASKILNSDAISMPNKLIDQVDIRLASHNSTHKYVVVTKPFDREKKYVLSISPLIMKFSDFRYRIRKEIQRGMVEVLLFDHHDRVPKTLLNGMVEYVSNQAGFDSLTKPMSELEGMNPRAVAQLLGYCEGKNEGFVRRLYQAMSRNVWDEFELEKALGTKSTPQCELNFIIPCLREDIKCLQDLQ